MGDKLVTIQNLEIIKFDTENNLLFIKGSIPGSKNSSVLIQKNSKKINKMTVLEKYKKMEKDSPKSNIKTKDKSKAPEKKIIEKKDPASEKSAVKKEDKKK